MMVQAHPGNLRVMDGYLEDTEIFLKGAFLLALSCAQFFKIVGDSMHSCNNLPFKYLVLKCKTQLGDIYYIDRWIDRWIFAKF